VRRAAALLAVSLAAAAAPADEPANQTVVPGTRRSEPHADAPVATEVIDRDELVASGARDVAEALAAHPGVRVERGLAGQVISLQGLDPEHTLVLVDGERVIGRVDGGLDLSRLALTDVERIEIVKGPASALYGSDAMGGVVNIVTRRAGRRLEAEAQSSYGSFGRFDAGARVSGSAGWLRSAASGGWQHGDGFDRDPSDVATTASAYDTSHAALELGLRPPPSTGWRADASVRWLERDQRGVDGSATGAIFDRRNLTETIDATLAPEWKPAAPLRLRLWSHFGSFRDQFVSDQRGSDALDAYADTREQLFESSLQLDALVGAHVLSAGVDGMFERLRTPRLSDGEGHRTRGALFVQDEWTVLEAPRLVLVPAVRGDDDSRFGAHLTPRLALRWDPVATFVVRASVGTGYRAPDFKELYLHFENPGVGYVVDGNPALAPETSRSATLGSEWRPVGALWLSAGVFRHDLDDLILATLVDPGGAGMTQRFSYVNVGAGHSQGAELAARWSLARTLRLDASYAFTDARDDTSGELLENTPRHRTTFAATWRPRDDGLELDARGSFVGQRRLGAERAPRYALVDLRAAWRFGTHLGVFGGVENLLDAGDAALNPIQPRTVYAGASASY
jgi:outer membrane receptor for ferrienterochelin and colicins